MLKRYTPLLRRSRIAPISKKRRKENSDYSSQRARFLSVHPFCQCFIARAGLNEHEVIEKNGRVGGFCVPRSTQVHHRAKRSGSRLNDERWWLAVCSESHDDIENNKGWAREQGFLLPIQADLEGRWGDGNQAETTAELLARRAKK